LAATRGTFLGGGVEHVTAVPLGELQGTCNEQSDDIFDPVCSELLRFTAKASGYVPLSSNGLSLAISLRAGVIQHLRDDSRTYPDRLFFLGGVDSIRGYTQYSLVPQDLAEAAKNPDNDISIDQVVLRGGDIFINPRVELRIPLSDTFQTAVFVDSGNLWQNRNKFNPLQLRYTTGTGLRISTPVGPLVFDYGLNIERFLDKTFRKNRKGQRSWEDLGAFHFSIGLF
jgi:outer membrane protein assembly factor BamA